MRLHAPALLRILASSHDKVTFINGQGTLPATPNSWHNELHPSSQGYQTFAELFHTTLKSLFPDRVF
jgi:lysophospholipase L1-like esterase